MKALPARGRHWLLRAALAVTIAGLPAPSAVFARGARAEPAAPTAAAPAAPAAVVQPIAVTPVAGYVGDTFSLSVDGLPALQDVELYWGTVDGSYAMQVFPETVEFYERKYDDRRVSIGRTRTDADGRLAAAVIVPEDYGEVHDIYAVIDGQDVARGGYRVLPEFTVSPLEGPIGTVVTIRAKGIGAKVWENTWAVNYDNKYSGFISAVTTRGTATAVIRASGPVGKHTVDIWHAGQTVPYLNWEESPQKHIPVFQFAFEVTSDAGAPAASIDWADPSRVATDLGGQWTTASGRATEGRATLSSAAGPIKSTVRVQAENLRPSAPAEVYWVTARGSRTSGLGWSLVQVPLGRGTTNAAGRLALDVEVPDDLGGWHSVQVVQSDKVVAETPYLLQPSLATLAPTHVKVGDTFQVQLKGVGWTELDNIYTAVYDNGFIGFACGFNSDGDVTLNLRASGAPGVHLIDLYPAVYQGHGKPPWLYDTPMLTFAQDHPSLSLGYRPAAFHLAITVE